MHTCEFSAALEACKRAKKIDRKIITITGGIHPTTFPEEGMGQILQKLRR